MPACLPLLVLFDFSLDASRSVLIEFLELSFLTCPQETKYIINIQSYQFTVFKTKTLPYLNNNYINKQILYTRDI